MAGHARQFRARSSRRRRGGYHAHLCEAAEEISVYGERQLMTGEISQDRFNLWTGPIRCLVFFLAAMSIWCLLADFYHLCSMQAFTLYILVPATLLLVILAMLDGS